LFSSIFISWIITFVSFLASGIHTTTQESAEELSGERYDESEWPGLAASTTAPTSDAFSVFAVLVVFGLIADNPSDDWYLIIR